MNACPDDDDFLRFLDGELDAEDDARIVAACGGLRRLPGAARAADARRSRARASDRRSRRCTPIAGRTEIGRDGNSRGRDRSRARRAVAGRTNSVGDAGADDGSRAGSRIDPGTSADSLDPARGVETEEASPRRPDGPSRDPDRTDAAGSGAIRELAEIDRAERLPASGLSLPATRSSSGWARAAWASSTRRGSAG